MTQQYEDLMQSPPLHPGLEALEDGFCMLDRNSRVTYWNAAADSLLGISRDAALGRVIWDVIPFLREGPTWGHLHQVARDGRPRRFLDAAPPTGRAAYLSLYASRTAAGEVVVHFRDATAEVAREEQYAALLESIRDGFIAVDPSWRITYLNAAAESLLRFPRDQAANASLWSLLPRAPDEIRDCLRATMDDGIQRHLREVTPEGRVFRGRIFDLYTYPLAGGGISILLEDVSERVQRERALARYAAEAEEANRAKSRFFAAVSHELRTPLNAIVGYTHLIASGTYGEISERAERAAERSSICAEHLARLVDDVLLLTTAEIGKLPLEPTSVGLQELLPRILETHRHQAEAKGLKFELVVPPDLPAVETDPQRLRQLLVALVSNAVKFTRQGRVAVHVTRLDEQKEGDYSFFPEPAIRLCVVDSGPGIPTADRERIFWPFEQVGDPARSTSMVNGTGLGLTIARQLAALLRGQLAVEDAAPRGSCFSVVLPVRWNDAA